VTNEKWLLPPDAMERLARHSELALFTGRTKWELEYTLERSGCRTVFSQIVTVEDVNLPKPDAEGLLKIAKGRDPDNILYLGDNVDDALAARAALVPFAGVLPRDGEERPKRAARLRDLGALTIFHEVSDLEHWLLSAAHHNSNPTSIRPRWWD
jgi:phosphoglycolate phosphatase-like HAD superfamily hydrolase